MDAGLPQRNENETKKEMTININTGGSYSVVVSYSCPITINRGITIHILRNNNTR